MLYGASTHINTFATREQTIDKHPHSSEDFKNQRHRRRRNRNRPPSGLESKLLLFRFWLESQ